MRGGCGVGNIIAPAGDRSPEDGNEGSTLHTSPGQSNYEDTVALYPSSLFSCSKPIITLAW